jgi:hypothetical protein
MLADFREVLKSITTADEAAEENKEPF